MVGMARSPERVLLITIRVAREVGATPVIVAREHQIWPSDGTATPQQRSMIGAGPDDVLDAVRDWLHDFVAE